MSLFGWIFGGSEEAEQETEASETEERPPKPVEEGVETTTVEKDLYEVTLHYQNGDSETRECYGTEQREFNFVLHTEFETELPKYDTSQRLKPVGELVNYTVLARDPIVEKVGTVEYEITVETELSWQYPMWSVRGKEWVVWRTITDHGRVDEQEVDTDE